MGQELDRILVVDDEPDMCWALKNILRPTGYAVTTTTKGTEALELLARESYAIAFVDVKLPDLDGLELASLIRQRNPDTAVVLISGYFYRDDGTIVEGLQKDLFVGFVSEPFDLEEIRLIVCRAVKHARGGYNGENAHSVGGR